MKYPNQPIIPKVLLGARTLKFLLIFITSLSVGYGFNSTAQCNPNNTSASSGFCAPAPSCGSGNVWTWSQSINQSTGNPATVRLWQGGTQFYDITSGLPSAITNGFATISIVDAVSHDGYVGRTSTAAQTNERWRLLFYKGSTLVYTSPYTGDIQDGVEQDYWRGALGSSFSASNGIDRIRIEHWSVQNSGGGANSVAPISLCINYTTCSDLTNGGTIAANQTFCNSGNPAPFTNVTLPSGGFGGTILYQWYYRTQIGSSWSIWHAIGGANGPTYNEGVIFGTRQYRRRAHRSATGCGNYVQSNYLTVTINKVLTSPGVIAADQTFCTSGNPALLTNHTSASGGSGGTIQYIWQKSSNNSTWSTISGATSATYDPPTISSTTYYRRGAVRSGCGGYLYTSSVKITIETGYTTPGSIGYAQTFCNSGNPAPFISLSNPGGATGGNIFITVYQWQVSTNNFSWTNISGATGSTYDAPTITSTRYYRRGARRGNCGSWVYTSSLKITINKPITSPGLIGHPQSFCNSGNPAPFVNVQHASGGTGGTVAYQWQRSTNNFTWTNISGATGLTYDAPTVVNDTWYRRGTKRVLCGNFLYTPSIKITINKSLSSPGSVGSPQTFCNSGNPAPFTNITFPSGGTGGIIQYVWQSSTNNISWSNIAGAFTYTYDAPTITSTRYYRRGARRSNCGGYVFTSPVKVTINKPVSSPGTIGHPQTFCNSGNPAAFVSVTKPGGNAGGIVVYQWQISTNNTSWSNISGATTETYNAPTITSTRYYRRGARNNVCGGYVFTSSVKITINKSLTSPGTIGSPQTFCNSGNPAAFTNITLPSGGTPGVLLYQWQSSTNNSIWTNIIGATGIVYDAPNITTTTYYRRGARYAGCGSLIYSSSVKITINKSLTSPGTIGSPQTFCNSGNPAAFTNVTLPSGGSGGIIQYVWQQSANNSSWTTILGATSSTYDAPTITSTTYYRRGARRSVCGGYIYASSVKVTVNKSLTSPGSVGSPQTFCNNGNPVPFTSIAPGIGGSGGTIVYQWQNSANNLSWTDVLGATNETYDAPAISSTTYYRRRARRTLCGSWLNTASIKITVDKELTSPGSIGSPQTFCNSGNPVPFTSIAVGSGGSGGTVVYQWQISGNNIGWANIVGATSATYDAPNLTNTAYYRRAARRNVCGPWLYTSSLKITIDKSLTSPGSIGSPQSFCDGGDPVPFTSIAVGTGGSGGTVVYQWQSSSNNLNWTNITGASGVTYDAPTISSTTYYRRAARRTACGSWLYTPSLEVTIQPSVDAGTDGTTTVCDHSTAAIGLAGLITGEDLGGTWTRLTGAGGIFNASNGTFIPSVGATTSTFRYSLTGTAPCPNDFSIATVNINICQVQVSGNVFNDVNGLKDNDVNGTSIGTPSGVSLYAVLVNSLSGNVVSSTQVLNNGTYQFPNVTTNTNYSMVLSTTAGSIGNPPPAVDLPNGWVNTGESPNNATSDGTVDGTQIFSVATVNVPNIDFGIREPLAIGNMVWVDSNKNGVIDGSEGPLSGAIVHLYEDNNNDGSPDGVAISSMTTLADGLYKFVDLYEGDYIVGVLAPGVSNGTYESSIVGEETDPNLDVDNNDNGITQITDEVFTGTVNLVANTEPLGETPNNTASVPDSNANLTIDFGFFLCPTSFAFDTVDLCVNTTFNLTSIEPSGFGGGVWRENSVLVPDPTSVSSGTYTYEYNEGNCSATGDVTLVDNIPDYTATIQVAPSAITGPTAVRVILTVSELLDKNSCSDVYILSPKLLPRFQFTYNPNATTVGGIAVDNGDWQYFENANPNFYIWKYTGTSSVFPSNGSSKIGYIGTYDPNNTDGQSTFSVQVFQGSGGETNQTNNTDSDLLIYFR